MCGIIAYSGKHPAMDYLLQGMEKLAYRGYDSNGLVLQNGRSFFLEKQPGDLSGLQSSLEGVDNQFTSGIGHTRWATHGPPNQENAHPHMDCDEQISVVHNGIIENHQPLKKELLERGHTFRSETDTEVIPHLLEEEYKKTNDPGQAIRNVTSLLKGSYALAILFHDHKNKVYGISNQSPLLIGSGTDGQFLASDIPALLHFTRDVVYLNDGELAEISKDSYSVFSPDGNQLSRSTEHIDWNVETAEKEGHDHFMEKEILEQPEAIRDTLAGRIDEEQNRVELDLSSLTPEVIDEIQRIQIVACGTSYHAGLIAKYYLQVLAGMPAEVSLASEFRYSSPPVDEQTLLVCISQSGETADTLAAHELAGEEGVFSLSICNVVGSTLARISDEVLYSRSGPEIGVAATKTYTTQIVTLLLFAIYYAENRSETDDSVTGETVDQLIQSIQQLPDKVEQALQDRSKIKSIASEYIDVYNFMFMGRFFNYPTALEGALKLKEISYIHAEGYAAGEMKHGPLALVEDTFPTVAIAPNDRVHDKMQSNIQEVHARDGNVIGLIEEGDHAIAELCKHVIELPPCNEFLTPILYTIPLQFLSYHTGVLLDRDIDQPRNLAKSVTVE